MTDMRASSPCPRCQRPRRMRYPNDEPEDGPARWTCPDEMCQAQQDEEEYAAMMRARIHTGRDLIEELRGLANELEQESGGSTVRAQAPLA